MKNSNLSVGIEKVNFVFICVILHFISRWVKLDFTDHMQL